MPGALDVKAYVATVGMLNLAASLVHFDKSMLIPRWEGSGALKSGNYT